MSDLHPHHDLRLRARSRLRIAAGLTLLLTAGEFLGGLYSGSLSLMSDAGHMLADLFALGLSLLSIAWATKPPSPQKTFGYYRIEILASLVNASLLFFVAFQIFWEAILRFATPKIIDVSIMFPVAIAGLAVNVISILLLRHEREHLITRSALYHVVADALSSVAVVAAAAIIYFGGFLRVDAVLSAFIACMIVVGGYRLFREALHILLEASPVHIPLGDVNAAILSIPGIVGVHDLHVWTISSGFHALSAHVCVHPMTLAESETLISRINEMLRSRFSVTHTTIQVVPVASPAKIQKLPSNP